MDGDMVPKSEYYRVVNAYETGRWARSQLRQLAEMLRDNAYLNSEAVANEIERISEGIQNIEIRFGDLPTDEALNQLAGIDEKKRYLRDLLIACKIANKTDAIWINDEIKRVGMEIKEIERYL